MNIDQVPDKGLNLSEDGTETLIEEIENATRYILHHDLAYRNLMVGDCQIEEGVIVDAVPYVIDFGMSEMKVNPSPSREGEKIDNQLRNLAKR
jgi:tRNA A-37 threonylcarbamoyl transferase component Bud32